MNNNMINPANYYNPFAKYNYVSKTRGVYLPKDAEIVEFPKTEKSTNIFSENYDAEQDVMQSMNDFDSTTQNGGLGGFINKFFKG